MDTVLVTGATGFLGYHVAKRLNEPGIRPRVLELRDEHARGARPPRRGALLPATWTIPRPCGRRAPASIRVLHLAFKVSVGGGAEARSRTCSGSTSPARSSCCRRRPPAACSARSWPGARWPSASTGSPRRSTSPRTGPSTPSTSRTRNIRRAGRAGRARPRDAARSRSSPSVPRSRSVPTIPSGAPANKLVQTLIAGKLRFTLPVGFGCLDVRDFASGVVLAAERGRSGQRYLLSGENVTTNQLLEQAAAIAGVRAPRFTPPTFLLRDLVGALELVSCASWKAGARHPRRASDHRPLRVVRHVEGARRARVDAAAAARDARRHDSLAAEPALERRCRHGHRARGRRVGKPLITSCRAGGARQRQMGRCRISSPPSESRTHCPPDRSPSHAPHGRCTIVMPSNSRPSPFGVHIVHFEYKLDRILPPRAWRRRDLNLTGDLRRDGVQREADAARIELRP